MLKSYDYIFYIWETIILHLMSKCGKAHKYSGINFIPWYVFFSLFSLIIIEAQVLDVLSFNRKNMPEAAFST